MEKEVGTRMGKARSNFEQMTWMRVRSRITEKCRTIMSQLLSIGRQLAAARCLRLTIKCNTCEDLEACGSCKILTRT